MTQVEVFLQLQSKTAATVSEPMAVAGAERNGAKRFFMRWMSLTVGRAFAKTGDVSSGGLPRATGLSRHVDRPDISMWVALFRWIEK